MSKISNKQLAFPLLFKIPLSSHVLIATLIILLGIGNILFGNSNLRQMDNFSFQKDEANQVEINSPFPLQADLNTESKEHRKTEHRFYFYSFVTRGGVALVALGASYLAIVGLWQVFVKVRKR